MSRRHSLPKSAALGSFACGVNLAGLGFAPSNLPGSINTDFVAPTNAELDYWLTRGVKIIRLSFLWERIQPTLGAALDSTHLALLTSLATHAASNGQKLILDVHNYGRYSVSGTPTTFGTGTVTSTNFANLWSRLATAFVGNSGVAGYDLMNEPHDLSSGTVWPTFAQAAVTAIRLVDTATAIYVEGDGWSSASAWTSNNPTLNITDPNNNLVYSAHFYFDSDSSGTYVTDFVSDGASISRSVSRISNFIGWLAANKFKGHIGEIGIPFADARWMPLLDAVLGMLCQYGIPFSYWSGGPWFGQGAYALSCEPNGTVGAYYDAPQVASITKYNGASQPSTYVLLPSSVQYFGRLAAAATITFSDNGAGGSFSPTTITLPAATTASTYNPSGTYTYTPPGGTAAVGVSSTNNGGLTDPPGSLIIASGNLTTSPSDQTQNWGLGHMIPTASSVRSALGNAMTLLTTDTSTNSHRIYQNIAKAASAISYTFWCIAKYNGLPLSLFAADNSQSNGVITTFNLSSGTISSAQSLSGSGFTTGTDSISSLGSGCYKCKITFTSNTATFITPILDFGFGTGDGVSGVYVTDVELR